MTTSRTFDTCIIGGGLAGVYAAMRLRQLGCTVALIERGSDGPPQLPNPADFEFGEQQYAGALRGQAYGVGGTSALWGGQLIPMTASDHFSPSMSSPEWPIRVDELKPHYQAVWRAFNLSDAQYDTVFCATVETSHPEWGFRKRHSFALPVGKRNVWTLWKGTLLADPGFQLFSNSRPIDFIMDGPTGHDFSVVGCRIAVAGGTSHLIRANSFVLAAGALESSRLVAAILRKVNGGLLPHTVGRPLCDHLSVPVGEIIVRDTETFREAFSPEFMAGGVRFKRYEATEDLRVKLDVPSAFLHVVYNGDAGFPSWLHHTFQAIQSRNWRRLLSQAVSGVRFTGHGIALAKGRVLHRRVEWPKGTRFVLQMDIEQPRDERNSVSCSAMSDNDFVSKLRIDWAVRERDQQVISILRNWVVQTWPFSPLAAGAQLIPLSGPTDVSSVFDVYHPFGLLGMGLQSAGAPLDNNCTVRGYRNLFVSSTAALPSIGVANPSLTMLALVNRLTVKLATDRSKRTIC